MTNLIDLEINSYQLDFFQYSGSKEIIIDVSLDLKRSEYESLYWVIKDNESDCSLGRNGEWIQTTLWVNRTAEVRAQTRFASPEEALACWNQHRVPTIAENNLRQAYRRDLEKLKAPFEDEADNLFAIEGRIQIYAPIIAELDARAEK